LALKIVNDLQTTGGRINGQDAILGWNDGLQVNPQIIQHGAIFVDTQDEPLRILWTTVIEDTICHWITRDERPPSRDRATCCKVGPTAIPRQRRKIDGGAAAS
jgi:hypothetical protein